MHVDTHSNGRCELTYLELSTDRTTKMHVNARCEQPKRKRMTHAQSAFQYHITIMRLIPLTLRLVNLTATINRIVGISLGVAVLSNLWGFSVSVHLSFQTLFSERHFKVCEFFLHKTSRPQRLYNITR